MKIIKKSIVGLLILFALCISMKPIHAYTQTQDGNYKKTGYHLEVADSWTCKHSADKMSTIECNCSGLNVNDTTIDNSVNIKLASGAPAFQIVKKENRILSEYAGVIGLNPVAHYILLENIGNGNSENVFEFTASAPWNKWNTSGGLNPTIDWGYAYFGIGFSYCPDTGMYYFVDTYHTWYATLGGVQGKIESHKYSYTHKITLYNILPNSYTIIYDKGEGTAGTVSYQTATYDTNIKLRKNDSGFTPPTGKHFVGWKDNATGKTYSAEESVKNLTSVQSGTVTLTAQYDWNTYNVVYNPNSTVTNNTAMDSYKLSNVSYPSNIKIYDNKYDRDGYTFAGWKDQYGNNYIPQKGSYATYSKLTTVNNDTVILYAQWVKTPYYICYNYDNSLSSKKVIQAVERDVVTKFLSVNELGFSEKTYGYDKEYISSTEFMFLSWNTSSTYYGGTTYYNLSNAYNLGSAGQTINLYARWYATLEYKNTRGIGNSTQSIFEANSFQTKASNIFTTPTGYLFDGWNTKQDGSGNAFEADTTYEKSNYSLLNINNGSATLYAQYNPITYVIKYDSNGGSGSMGNTTMTYDEEKIISKMAFTPPTGKVFDCWKDISTGITYSDQQSVINLASTKGVVVTLTAQWKVPSYTIKFNSNASNTSGTMNDYTAICGNVFSLPQNTFSRYGYSFSYWSISPQYLSSSVVKRYQDKESITSDLGTYNSTVTLYAHWSERGYEVVYDSNGGSGDMSDDYWTYNEHWSPEENAFNSPTGKETFEGWNTEPDGTGMDFDPMGGYNDAMDDFIKNYTTGYYGSSTPVLTLYAQWSGEKTYTIKYNTNGGLGSMSDDIAVCGKPFTLKQNIFSKYGYWFSYWSISPQYSSPSVFKRYLNRATITSDLGTANSTVTLYAHWSEDSYDVVYDANGGSGEMEIESFDYTYGWYPEENMFNSPTGKETFLGWNTKPDGTGMDFDLTSSYNDSWDDFIKNYTTGYNGSSTPVLTLYAQWSGLDEYKVKFNPNGGSGSMADQTFKRGTPQKLSTCTFISLYGYTFAGWYTNTSYTGISYSDQQSVNNLTTAGNVVNLYARWNTEITYDANGGSGSMDKQSVYYDALFTVSENAYNSPTGFVFDGWNTKADGSGVSYSAGQAYSYISSVDGNVVLFAQWKAGTYRIVYHGNGGDQLMPAQEMQYGVPAKLYKNIFEKNYYIFAGWNTRPDGGGIGYVDEQEVENMTGIKDGAIHLYAIWTHIAQIEGMGTWHYLHIQKIRPWHPEFNEYNVNLDTFPQSIQNEVKTADQRYAEKDYLVSYTFETTSIDAYKEVYKDGFLESPEAYLKAIKKVREFGKKN